MHRTMLTTYLIADEIWKQETAELGSGKSLPGRNLQMRCRPFPDASQLLSIRPLAACRQTFLACFGRFGRGELVQSLSLRVAL